LLQQQLEAMDPILEKKSAENPLFKEVVESQRRFAERTVRWDLDTYVNRRMAYNYYFGKKPAGKPAVKGAEKKKA
jgi:TRAP-type mannitol/chloroaromatic compound transport system substrate-binding protein